MKLVPTLLIALALFQNPAAKIELPALIGVWNSTVPEPAPPNTRMIPPKLIISVRDGKAFVALGDREPAEAQILAPFGRAAEVAVVVMGPPTPLRRMLLRPIGLDTLRFEMYTDPSEGRPGRYYEESFKKGR